MGGIVEAPLKVADSLISGIASAGASALGAITGLIKPKVPQINIDIPQAPAPAPIPEIPAPAETLMTPTAMPSPNSSEVRQAKRRSAASQLARRGRSSTILTDTDALGG